MKKIIFMLAAATVMVSCAKTEIVDNNAQGVLIKAKPAHQLVDGTVTRAPFAGSIAADNQLIADVLTYNQAGDIHANGTMTFNNSTDPVAYATTGFTGNNKFTGAATDTYTLFGFYPAGWTKTPATMATDNAKITFDGKSDVMVAAAATTSEAGVKSGSYPMLTFEHKLTKLIVKVQAMNPAAAAIWTEVEAITLTKVQGNAPQNEATYNLDSGNVTFGGTTATIPFYMLADDAAFAGQSVDIQLPVGAAGSNILPVAYSMIESFNPQDDKDITLSVKADGKTDAVDVNLNIPMTVSNTAGYAYTITLTFTDNQEIVATAEVVDWVEGDIIGGIVM